MKPIRKVLIANRGEIAIRIMKTARARGIATVAVYSDADKNAMHVRYADEAIRIGPPEATQSYLNIEAILDAACRTRADAIHPGYGFLSERSVFAEACAEAGIIFIGPPASAIAAMGDKAQSKRLMINTGVPCIPGYQDDDQSDEALISAAERIGFPVMLKASAGGGGRGQRIVHRSEDVASAIASARRESESTFGDGRLIVEKAVIGARHVEIQILADAHGNCLSLGERDCSLQRRRQKVIEEAPSPAISEDVRRAMSAAALNAARAVGYSNAGTVEFLFDPATQEFYFLEMNTRLQVEHPVTECVTELDIVDLQFDIAEGKPLRFRQDDIRVDGWAIEARLYAEDPSRDFLPDSGRIELWREPTGEGIRVDSGVEQGDRVSPYYDPMIAKVIAKGATREQARMRLAMALRRSALLGIAHNRDFLVSLLEDQGFVSADAATDYIESNLERLAARRLPGGDDALGLVAAAMVDAPFGHHLTGWRSRGASTFPLRIAGPDGIPMSGDVTISGSRISVQSGEHVGELEVVSRSMHEIRYISAGRAGAARYLRSGSVVEIDDGGACARYTDLSLAPAMEAGGGSDFVKAPMAGAVTSVAARPGDIVKKGQLVATIEAMKMEHQLKAPRDGVVRDVLVRPGDHAAIRATLITLEPESGS